MFRASTSKFAKFTSTYNSSTRFEYEYLLVTTLVTIEFAQVCETYLALSGTCSNKFKLKLFEADCGRCVVDSLDYLCGTVFVLRNSFTVASATGRPAPGRHLSDGQPALFQFFIHFGLDLRGLAVLRQLLRSLFFGPFVVNFRCEVDNLNVNALGLVEAGRHWADVIAHFVAFPRDVLTVDVGNVQENRIRILRNRPRVKSNATKTSRRSNFNESRQFTSNVCHCFCLLCPCSFANQTACTHVAHCKVVKYKVQITAPYIPH